MARSGNVDKKTINAIMLKYIDCESPTETAKAFPSMSKTTVSSIISRYKDKDKYVKLRDEKKEKMDRANSEAIDSFVEDASRLIDVSLKVMLRRVMSDFKRDQGVVSTGDLNKIVGTLYDKRALACGESTDSISISVKLPPEADPYAG